MWGAGVTRAFLITAEIAASAQVVYKHPPPIGPEMLYTTSAGRRVVKVFVANLSSRNDGVKNPVSELQSQVQLQLLAEKFTMLNSQDFSPLSFSGNWLNKIALTASVTAKEVAAAITSNRCDCALRYGIGRLPLLTAAKVLQFAPVRRSIWAGTSAHLSRSRAKTPIRESLPS